MFHIAAYFENIDTGGLLARIDPVVDQALTIQNNAFIIPTWAQKLMAIYGQGLTMNQIQMQSPKFRETSEYDVPNFENAFTPPSNPAFNDLLAAPRPLQQGEGFEAHVSEVAVGAEDELVAIWLEGDREAVPDGVHEVIRATAVLTSIPNQWVLAPLVLGQQLRAGQYAIVDAWCFSATGILFRFVLEQQVARPGKLVFQLQSQHDNDELKCPKAGVWGKFYSTFIPQLELLTQGIDSAAIVYIEVVKVGELPG